MCSTTSDQVPFEKSQQAKRLRLCLVPGFRQGGYFFLHCPGFQERCNPMERSRKVDDYPLLPFDFTHDHP